MVPLVAIAVGVPLALTLVGCGGGTTQTTTPAPNKELVALTADTYNELALYKGAVFFGHMNPDADSIGSAMGASEYFGDGIPACPMNRDKCPNPETVFLMFKFNVSLHEVPCLNEIQDLSKRSIVLVDFNDVSHMGTLVKQISSQLVDSGTGLWKTPPVIGSIDHHALDIDVKTELPEFVYNKSSTGMVIETHPWGSGTSIIALKFRESGRRPSLRVAGMMLGAILSDTLGLTSPNTTPYDEEAVAFLAPIAGVMDVQVLYEGQAQAKSSWVLTGDLFDVFDGDLKTYETVPGKAKLVIGSVEVYGSNIYNALLAKDDTEVHKALSKVHKKYYDEYVAEVGDLGFAHTYIWIVDVENFVSTVLSLSDDYDSCIALHAMDKAAVSVLAAKKECRPNATQPVAREGFTSMATGSCVSRKSQLQPSLQKAVRDFHKGSLPCSKPNEVSKILV